LQKPTDGAQRQADRLRDDRPRASSASRFNGRSIRAARAIRARLRGGLPFRTGSLSASLAAALRPFRTAERVLPIAVAVFVAVASLLALLPNTPQGAVGGTQGGGRDVRVAIGGGSAQSGSDIEGPGSGAGAGLHDPSFEPFTISGDTAPDPAAQAAATEAGAFLDDGTLLTGYAPQTTVVDGSNLIQSYRVKSGDTLVTIARQYRVSMMTLWWANKLPAKDELHVGQILRIPPVDGLVVTVGEADTLDSLAAKYNVDAAEILDINGLDDPTLVVGQVLVLPGALGAAVPTPKPTPKPVVRPRTTSSRSSAGVTSRYSGGAFKWPVVGGHNYISQYYHYGHWAIDIAADYGSPVIAAAAGKVTFAGWKSNGGGYQVWISHGSNLYTTYNHMSAITVGTGQSVSRGTQVGRIGATGDATGPHLHFEVWIGQIWSGGTRVNPLKYF
jgi:murein DD-endopeptidase MepM/ murein hydrolase activator NlpD